MMAIFLLLGVGLAVSAIALSGDDGDDGAGAEPQELTEGDDQVIGADYRGGAESYLADLVAEGELSQAEADAFLAETLFPDSPVNLDAGAGDDAMLGTAGDDTLLGGVGNDYIAGGAGDDLVVLGDGEDVYGIDERSASLPDDILFFPVDSGLFGSEEDYEGGDDTVVGGAGNDAISDSYGANEINGQQGDDFIISVDQDGLTPDTVLGGHGDDILVVDQGDLVNTSLGADLVTVDLFAGVAAEYQVVTIDDFDPSQDRIELEGASELLRGPAPSGPDDVVENPVTVTDLEDGSGAVISVNGIPVVVVIGGQGMTIGNVLIST